MAGGIIIKQKIIWNNFVNGYLSDADWMDRNVNDSHTTFENGVATTKFLNEEPAAISYRTMMQKTTPKVKTDHIYFATCEVNPSRNITSGVEWAGGYQDAQFVNAEVWTRMSFRRYGRRNENGYLYVPFVHGTSNPGLIVKTRNVLYIDLTQMYGSGNEPSIEEFEAQCVLNGIDLSSPQSMDSGTTKDWYVLSESNLPNLSEARRRIIVSSPHIESPAPAGLVSFNTNMIAPLKECKIHFEPKQDLNGYSKPWVGGSGKNLWDNNNVIYNTWTSNDGTATKNSSGCRTLDMEVTSGDVYTVFYNGERPYSASIIELDENKNFILRTHKQWAGSSSPSALTVTIGANTKYCYVQTYTLNGETMTFALLTTYKIQLEKGSTATAYEPYENICPINGQTKVEVYQTGKNLFSFDMPYQDPSNISLYNTNDRIFTPYTYAYGASYSNWWQPTKVTSCTINANEIKLTTASSDYGVGFAIPIKGGQTICLNYINEDNTGRVYFAFYRNDGKYLTGGQIYSGTSRSVPNEADIGVFILSSYNKAEATFSDISITLGDFLSYEPYSGTIFPIDWTDSAGTVYGGYVDLVTGEVWKTWEEYNLSNITWNAYGNNNGVWYTVSVAPRKPNTIIMCDTFPTSTSFGYSSLANYTLIYGGSNINLKNFWFINRDYISSDPDGHQDITAFRNWIANVNAKAYGILATPILITTLTSSQLKSLRGANNIWSSANGNIELSYWKH